MTLTGGGRSLPEGKRVRSALEEASKRRGNRGGNFCHDNALQFATGRAAYALHFDLAFDSIIGFKEK